jgi:hypothetical protein
MAPMDRFTKYLLHLILNGRCTDVCISNLNSLIILQTEQFIFFIAVEFPSRDYQKRMKAAMDSELSRILRCEGGKELCCAANKANF